MKLYVENIIYHMGKCDKMYTEQKQYVFSWVDFVSIMDSKDVPLCTTIYNSNRPYTHFRNIE